MRAVETAEALVDLVVDETVVTKELARRPTDALLRVLRGKRITVVGHQPWLGELIAILALGRPQDAAQFELRKGVVVRLEGSPRPRGMVVRAVLPPKVRWLPAVQAVGARKAKEGVMGFSDRLRIAFVADTITTGQGGGVASGRYVVDALRRHGHTVHVVAVDAMGPDDRRLPGFQLPLRAMQEMQFTMTRPDRAVLASVFREVDVVHVQLPFWLGLVAVEEARRAGKPVVAAFHVQPENALFNVGVHSAWLCRLIYRAWVSRIYNRADAVVCPTAFARRKLRQYGLSVAAHVVSNGVPPDIGAGPASRGRDDTGNFVILAVGRLAAEKRQDVIIEAIHRSRHRDRIRLIIAGTGPKEAQLRALGAELPHPPEIGFLPRERLIQLLGSADLFVHASEVELEGMAVLEAMAEGLPVLVAQGTESAASALAISDDFRFPAGNASALAARIDALVEHPELLAAARDGYRAAVRAFEFANSIEALVAIYRSVSGVRAESPVVPRPRAAAEARALQTADRGPAGRHPLPEANMHAAIPRFALFPPPAPAASRC
jgi:glycosyltransferase involved in cell wall biosynthesis